MIQPKSLGDAQTLCEKDLTQSAEFDCLEKPLHDAFILITLTVITLIYKLFIFMNGYL
jgi:hypothetical protein